MRLSRSDGIDGVMAQAKAAAGDRDVLVHGAYTAQRALEAGVLDELQIHQIPVLFGRGRRLFEELPSRVELEIVRMIDTPEATHIRYRVRRWTVVLVGAAPPASDAGAARLDLGDTRKVRKDVRRGSGRHNGRSACRPDQLRSRRRGRSANRPAESYENSYRCMPAQRKDGR